MNKADEKRLKRVLFGAGLVLSLGWAFVTLGMLSLAAQMRRPCRCGRAHDPLDAHPEGEPSLRGEALEEALETVANTGRKG